MSPEGPANGGNEESRAALERAVSALKTALSAIRGIPRILLLVLWGSVLSGLGLAWFWFLRHEPLLVKWLAAPWLALLAVPQVGLWLLASSLRELLSLPERLLALKSGVASQGEFLLQKIRRADPDSLPEGGFLKKLKEAYALHGELSQVLAARAVLHRITGPLVAVVGPVSFLLNCLVILVAIVQLAIVLA